MIKRTLFFGSPGYLHTELSQLVYIPRAKESQGAKKTMPIEDLGIVIIESPQITITSQCLQSLSENNTAIVFCDKTHMPTSLLLPFADHTLAHKHTQAQILTSEAVKGRLWKQTVCAKIKNQAECLSRAQKKNSNHLKKLSLKVKNADPDNIEGQAARIYFQTHFENTDTLRSRFGNMPNPALNYGYAILRAAMARALVGSGLTCILGIHHTNQYNPFVLADDIMEPYRPFVDDLILNDNPLFSHPENTELSKEMKANILSLLTVDVVIEKMRRPLLNALSYTTASLARCYLKETDLIRYPEFAKCPPPITP